MKSNTDQRQDWVIEYIRNNTEASAINQDFHEKFHAKFGGARKETFWGAQPVRAAQGILSKLAKDGILEARRISLGFAWQQGFPRHVLSYSLPSSENAIPATEVAR